MSATVVDLLGWASSLVLLVTLNAQLRKQWRERSSAGVSVWLFLGQLLASLGFCAYSALKGDAVFVVTNALLSFSAAFGLVLKRRDSRSAAC